MIRQDRLGTNETQVSRSGKEQKASRFLSFSSRTVIAGLAVSKRSDHCNLQLRPRCRRRRRLEGQSSVLILKQHERFRRNLLCQREVRLCADLRLLNPTRSQVNTSKSFVQISFKCAVVSSLSWQVIIFHQSKPVLANDRFRKKTAAIKVRLSL
jgi:hypothetical protein